MAKPRPLPLTMVVRAGARLAIQGVPTSELWIVQRGALVAERITHDGRRFAWILGPGDPVGEPHGVDSSADVRALRPCRLRAVVAGRGAHAMSRRAHALACAAADLAWAPVVTRVERVLVDVARRFGRPVAGGRALGLRLDQELVAALAGTTRESANRAIRSLQRRGRLVAVGRGRYVIVGEVEPTQAIETLGSWRFRVW